jgi:hypothetical protein
VKSPAVPPVAMPAVLSDMITRPAAFDASRLFGTHARVVAEPKPELKQNPAPVSGQKRGVVGRNPIESFSEAHLDLRTHVCLEPGCQRGDHH